MNRWRSFKNWGLAFGLLAAVAASGCYSGWSKKGNGSDPDPSKPAPAAKKIGLAVVDVISMTGKALNDRNCSMVPVSLADLRWNEGSMRLKLLTDALNQVADAVIVRVVDITQDDCLWMTGIEHQAFEPKINGLDSIPSDVKDRPAVHIRFVYWLGDLAKVFPSESVVSADWAAMGTLQAAGYNRRLSVNQFVLTPMTYSGYVGSWATRSSVANVYYAPTVDDLSPDQDGMKALTDAARKGTSGFISWLLTKVSEI